MEELVREEVAEEPWPPGVRRDGVAIQQHVCARRERSDSAAIARRCRNDGRERSPPVLVRLDGRARALTIATVRSLHDVDVDAALRRRPGREVVRLCRNGFGRHHRPRRFCDVADDRSERDVRILPEVAAAARPHDEVSRFSGAPVRKLSARDEGTLRVRERGAAGGACAQQCRRARMVDALYLGRTDHERLERRSHAGCEAAPHPRRLEEERLILAASELAVEARWKARIAEERVRAVDQ